MGFKIGDICILKEHWNYKEPCPLVMIVEETRKGYVVEFQGMDGFRKKVKNDEIVHATLSSIWDLTGRRSDWGEYKIFDFNSNQVLFQGELFKIISMLGDKWLNYEITFLDIENRIIKLDVC